MNIMGLNYVLSATPLFMPLSLDESNLFYIRKPVKEMKKRKRTRNNIIKGGSFKSHEMSDF
jgi:hypothetical protein